MNNAAWKDFVPGRWQEAIDVRDFIQLNYTPYTEGPEFLSEATPRTKALMEKVQELFAPTSQSMASRPSPASGNCWHT